MHFMGLCHLCGEVFHAALSCLAGSGYERVKWYREFSVVHVDKNCYSNSYPCQQQVWPQTLGLGGSARLKCGGLKAEERKSQFIQSVCFRQSVRQLDPVGVTDRVNIYV